MNEDEPETIDLLKAVPANHPTKDSPLFEWAVWYYHHEVSGIGSIHTQNAKRLDLEKFIAFVDSDNPIASIMAWSKAITQAFIRKLRRNYKSSSVHRTLATLTHFARYLERKHILDPDENPLQGVQRPPRPAMKPKHIVLYEPGGDIYMEGPPAYDRLLEAADAEIKRLKEHGPRRFPRRVWPYRDKALLQFLYHTGLRVSEACNIDYDQMQDLKNQKAKKFVKVLSKGNKEREIFLDSVATQGLTEFLLKERGRRLGPLFPSPQLGKGGIGKKNDYTMDAHDFKRLTRGSVGTILKRLGRIAASLIGEGFYFKIHPHRLRHERGYNLKMAGGDASDIQKELGHSTPQYVALYSQPSEDERYEWLNSVGKRMQIARQEKKL